MSAVAAPAVRAPAAGAALLRACARLRRHGILAVGEATGDPAATRLRLTEALRDRFPDGSCCFVFWADREAVDVAGRLVRPVTLHYGSATVEAALRSALAEQGLTVRAGPQPLTVCVSG